MKSKIAGMIILLVMFLDVGAVQMENEGRLAIFETVWNKVNATYFDPAFGAVDWQEAHDRYRPLIAAAKDDKGFHTLINRMLWELKVSHAAYIPPGYFAAVEPLVFAAGGIGIAVRMLNGQAVITTVDPGSPAHQAGLRCGWVIQAIDGITVDQVAKEVRRDRPPFNDRNRLSQTTKGILGRIYGAPETEVAITFADDNGKSQRKQIRRVKRSGKAVGPGGMFFFAIEFEAKHLGDGIGYLRLNTLQPPLTRQVAGAIQSMGAVPGLILDLRGNSGGEIEGMPDLFLSEKKLLYLRKDRNSETKIFSGTTDHVYQGPLAVLVDVTSGSAGELLAACLQATGRAKVVGDRSPGSVMESDTMVLPNGAIFMYPVARLTMPEGAVLEDHGVIPDIKVGLKREMLLRGIDSQLEAALEYLKKEIRKGKK